MSWSFNHTGLPAVVLQAARDTLLNWECAEPEQSLRQYFSTQLETALRSWPADKEVFVTANGSQYKSGKNEDGNDGFCNSLTISIGSIALNFIPSKALAELIDKANTAEVLQMEVEAAKKRIAELEAAPLGDSDGGNSNSVKVTATAE